MNGEFSTHAIDLNLEKVCSFSLWWMIFITLPSGNAIFHTHVAYGIWKLFMAIYIMLVFVNIDYVDIPIEKLSLI
jgi:Ni,Fe-hydrogenase I cytochrome b subunit